MDFKFLQNPLSKKWVILAPRRAKRPDEAKGTAVLCPFCPGSIQKSEVVYQVSAPSAITNEVKQSQEFSASSNNNSTEIVSSSFSKFRTPRNDNKTDWSVIVLKNKFPFAPTHEIIVHSPDHHKNFDELPLLQTISVLQVYRQRFQTHQGKGQVYIFQNHGEGGGESLPHPHTQLTVVPSEVVLDTPALDPNGSIGCGPAPEVLEGTKEPDETRGAKAVKVPYEEQPVIVTDHFSILCPATSQWPDEVWILPKRRFASFGEITDEEIDDLAATLVRIIHILDLRHGHEFPFNFYIYPGNDWYLRLIPRQKSLGGFEIGTGIYVNTQDPKETAAFIKEHFKKPDLERIKMQQANYSKKV